MRSALKLAAIFVALTSASVLAQWPKFTPSGVPLADGKVNENAPTPRTADGKPDLSGVWNITRDPSLPPPGRGQRGGGGGGGFGNIGGNMPNQTAPYQPWAADLVKKRQADNSKDNPDAHCLPMGIGQLNAHPYPRKIVQTPTEILLIYEGSGTTVREVFMDGRPLPKKEDVEPWWNGYSVGHWDGDTLVIETTGFMDDGWLDVRGSPLTSAGKITERFRRPRYGLLELEEIIDDPKVYTQPFSAKLFYRPAADTQLIEFVCLDKDAGHYVGGTPAAAK